MIEAFLINPPRRKLKKGWAKRSLGGGKRDKHRYKEPRYPSDAEGAEASWFGGSGVSEGFEASRFGQPKRRKKRRNPIIGVPIIPFFNPKKRRNPFGEEVMIVGANPRELYGVTPRYRRSRDEQLRLDKYYRGKKRTTRSRVRTMPKRKEVLENMFDNPRRRKRSRRRRRTSPLQKAFAFMGPRRRRRRRVKAVRRRRRRVAVYAPPRRRRRRVRAVRRRRRVAAVYAPPRRRRRRRRRAVALDRYGYPVRRRRRRRRRATARRRRRRVMYFNPRRRRRGFLRNPPAVAALSWRRPMSLLMPAAIGTAAFIVTGQAPVYANVTGMLPTYGVKAAVMIGGGMAVSKFLGSRNGQIWMLGSLINIASDLVKQFIFKTAAVAGLGYFPYQEISEYPQYSAYPEEFSSPYGAFPY